MNNISPIRSDYTEFPLSNQCSGEFCAHSYQISESAHIEIWVDELGRLKGVYRNNMLAYEISPGDIRGIPEEVRLNLKYLAKFLEGTYVRCVKHQDLSTSITVCPRMLGGGHKHSKVKSTKHWQQPEPPTRTTVIYPAGFLIHQLNIDGGSGGIEWGQGGLYESNLSFVFVSDNAALRPRVDVCVWRKDYYAGKIGELHGLKNQVTINQGNFEKRIAEVCAKVQEISANILVHREDNTLVEPQLQEAEASLFSIRQELVQKREENRVATLSLQEESNFICSLFDFLEICPQMGISIQHPSLLGLAENRDEVLFFKSLQRAQGNLLTQVVNAWNGILEASKEAEGQHIIGILGRTGVGKSTLVNHLLGCPMGRVQGKIIVTDPTQEIAKIGHGVATSETLLPKVCRSTVSPLVFTDFGGIYDTRGVSEEISVSASIYRTLKYAESVKLVVCVDARNLAGRALSFAQDIELFLGSLLGNYTLANSSLIILFTHPNLKDDGSRFCTADALDDLRAIHREKNGQPEQSLYSFILRENGRYVHVYDPLSEHSKETISHLLGEMDPIQNHREIIQGAYIPSVQARLKEEVVSIAERVFQKLIHHQRLRATVGDWEDQESALEGQRESLNQRILLANQNINQKLQEGKPLDQEIIHLNGQLAATAQECQSLTEKITKLNTEDMITYQCTDGVNWRIISGEIDDH